MRGSLHVGLVAFFFGVAALAHQIEEFVNGRRYRHARTFPALLLFSPRNRGEPFVSLDAYNYISRNPPIPRPANKRTFISLSRSQIGEHPR